MGILDLALELYADMRLVAAEGDHLEVGDTEVVEIPHAEALAALLIKGKSGKRFRITGLQVEREK